MDLECADEQEVSEVSFPVKHTSACSIDHDGQSRSCKCVFIHTSAVSTVMVYHIRYVRCVDQVLIRVDGRYCINGLSLAFKPKEA